MCEETPILWTVVCDTIKKIWKCKVILISILDIWIISSSLQISHFNGNL